MGTVDGWAPDVRDGKEDSILCEEPGNFVLEVKKNFEGEPGRSSQRCLLHMNFCLLIRLVSSIGSNCDQRRKTASSNDLTINIIIMLVSSVWITESNPAGNWVLKKIHSNFTYSLLFIEPHVKYPLGITVLFPQNLWHCLHNKLSQQSYSE